MSKYISKYIEDTSRIMYGYQADKKKISKKIFNKEIEAAIRYGEVGLAEEIFNQHSIEPFKSVDEILGAMEIEMKKSYDKIGKTLNIRLKGYKIGEALKYE